MSPWLIVVIAGLLETGWALGLKYSEGFTRPIPSVLTIVGALASFWLLSIAMKDLLQEMEKSDDDLIDIACGCAFLWLLLKRHGSIAEATAKFCDPKDRDFYVDKVMGYMKVFE